MENPYKVKHIRKILVGKKEWRYVRLNDPSNWNFKTSEATRRYLNHMANLNWHIHYAGQYNDGSWN